MLDVCVPVIVVLDFTDIFKLQFLIPLYPPQVKTKCFPIKFDVFKPASQVIQYPSQKKKKLWGDVIELAQMPATIIIIIIIIIVIGIVIVIVVVVIIVIIVITIYI